MDMYVRFHPEKDEHVKKVWLDRVAQKMEEDENSLFHETATIEDSKIIYHRKKNTINDVLSPRMGIYFDMSQVGVIRIVWNHMQMDGVGLWGTTREIYDDNPPLVPYKEVKSPPPILPEILSIPKVAGQAVKRGSLYKGVSDRLHTGQARWESKSIRKLKSELNLPFNLLTSAMVAKKVFDRHPQCEKLNLGLTVFFPFLKARNRYGVIIVRVKRGEIHDIAAQLKKKIPKPLVMWGNTATQAYAMERVPDSMFLRLMKYYRKQIDVLISNVPVGNLPISVGDVPVQIICHTRGLSLPYYFLMMGTREDIHVSYSTLYSQNKDFFQKPFLDK